MKKKYIPPELIISDFEGLDIIARGSGSGFGDNEGDDYDTGDS